MKKPMFSLVIFLIFLCYSISSAQSETTLEDVNHLMMKEDYQNCIPLLESLISKDSSDAGLYYKLGVCYQKEYLYDKAINSFARCIKLDSTNIPARFSLGNCYSELGDDKNVLNIYTDLFQRDSVNCKVGIMKASALIRLNKYQDAFDTYQLLFKKGFA